VIDLATDVMASSEMSSALRHFVLEWSLCQFDTGLSCYYILNIRAGLM
jgi:hypothetical protein